MATPTMCATCATEFRADQPVPRLCPICADDRQYIPPGGQRWTSFEALAADHTVRIEAFPGMLSSLPFSKTLYSLQVSPGFGIDQRALLVCSPGGNILWDCIPLIDGPTVEFVRSLGGLKTIVISHPHYYSVMLRWAETFDCPIYIHELERPWVFNGGERVRFWQGEELTLWEGIDVVRIGGHFPGSSVLRVPAFSPKGALLTGDTLYLSRSLRHIAMMYSYPNQIPLPMQELRAVVKKVTALEFDTLYGAFPWQDLPGIARDVFIESLKRYDCL